MGKTVIDIADGKFMINGEYTYKSRKWNGIPIEGLLFNTRMVQGIFDDKNPETVTRWAYPDTGKWDAERNTREFVEAMPVWKEHGVLCFTINLQGGSPEGYSQDQPWHNSAFLEDGSLDEAYMRRLEKILNKADEIGMAVILGYFYFGQENRLKDEAAIISAVDNATDWVIGKEYENVLIEVNNECDVVYKQPI
ncbi:MAG TPA: glycoside hydrolase family 5 protein, partial [Clostridiaceae bacterium]|nr:glycoside hydrolase family 5 protein [Clostridiaceae bacterium]